jgi:hypothetical protein
VHSLTLSSKERPDKGNGRSDEENLHAFLRDVSTPLSAVALHLETASRRLSRGEDPAKWIGVAKKELGKALDMFERGRTQILTGQLPPGKKPRAARPVIELRVSGPARPLSAQPSAENPKTDRARRRRRQPDEVAR